MEVQRTSVDGRVVGFNYEGLPESDAKTVSEAAEAIRSSQKRTISYILAIGEKLLNVKTLLKHGQFEAWLAAEFSWTPRTAQNYMSVWEVFGEGKYETVSLLQPTTLYKLAAPSTPTTIREDVIKRLDLGERLEDTSIKEMIKAAKQDNKTGQEGPPEDDTEDEEETAEVGRSEEAAQEPVLEEGSQVTVDAPAQQEHAAMPETGPKVAKAGSPKKPKPAKKSEPAPESWNAQPEADELEPEENDLEQEEQGLENEQAAEQAVQLLKERLTDADFKEFVKLLERAGTIELAQKLGVPAGMTYV